MFVILIVATILCFCNAQEYTTELTLESTSIEWSTEYTTIPDAHYSPVAIICSNPRHICHATIDGVVYIYKNYTKLHSTISYISENYCRWHPERDCWEKGITKFRCFLDGVCLNVSVSADIARHMFTKMYKLNSIEDTSSSSEEDIDDKYQPDIIDQSNIGRHICLEEWTSVGARQKWCATPVGRPTFPCETPCKDRYGNATVRWCELIQGVPTWSAINNPCVNTTFSSTTSFLSDVRNVITPLALANVSSIIQTNSSLLTIQDIDIIANILSNTVNQPTKMEYKEPFFQTVNSILDINKTFLENSREFGSTDKIIQSVDKFLVDLSKETTSAAVSLPNIAFEIIKPTISDSQDYFAFTFQEVSAKIPNNILNTSILTIFKNSNLFFEGNVSSEIADLKVLGVNGTLDNPVSIYLHTDPSMEVVCSFWKYNDQEIGNWSTEGVQTIRISDYVIECRSNHLTAFALLGVSNTIIENLSEANQLALQIITTILCVFSLIGLIIVFITCFWLKKWWKNRVNTIALSSVILVEVLMLFFNEIVTINDGLGCIFFGVVMHYLVLSKFIVMLFIAKMQYENFVTVLTSKNKSRRLLINASISFSVPILVVGISAGVFPQHYNSGNVQFCYPKAEAFKYFVIIPIASVLLANVIIFSMVMYKISISISRDAKQKILQAKLAVMLFFMLGLTWLFSIFSHVFYTQWVQLVFVYIFSILSPLQGFVIFLFAIVMDSDAKRFWQKCYDRVRYAPLDRESSNVTTTTAVLMSNLSQSSEDPSEQGRLKSTEDSHDN